MEMDTEIQIAIEVEQNSQRSVEETQQKHWYPHRTRKESTESLCDLVQGGIMHSQMGTEGLRDPGRSQQVCVIV
jgi:hypothetical protein